MTLQRALAYLEKLPPAIAGSGGHNATLRAACECVRFGLSEGEAWEAVQWFNAHRCLPAWSERELRHKLADAQKIVAASGQAGARARPMRHKAAQQWRPPTAPASLRLTFAGKVATPPTTDTGETAQVARPQPADVARPGRLITGRYTDAQVRAMSGQLVSITRLPDERNECTWREVAIPPARR